MNEQVVPQGLKPLFTLLDKQGMNPRMCDTPVPFYDRRVPCGSPSEMGDSLPDGYMLLPHGVRGVSSRFSISVSGDSMHDAGIDDGDELDVLSTPVANDGDIVVAVVEGESTVKMFFTDQFGLRWLVPCNARYEPMLLEKFDSAYIAGRVVKVHKDAVRGSYRELSYRVSESDDYIAKPKRDDAARVRSVVQEVAPRVMQKRQWYAVYRALMDLRVWKGDAYAEFVQCVCDAVPEHEHLPSVPELRRMEVLSFARPVASWDSGRAPVTGVRFDAYLQIAQATAEAWEA